MWGDYILGVNECVLCVPVHMQIIHFFREITMKESEDKNHPESLLSSMAHL